MADICWCCNGSGEGQADGTWCRVCRGSGEVPTEEDLDDYEAALEADAESKMEDRWLEERGVEW